MKYLGCSRHLSQILPLLGRGGVIIRGTSTRGGSSGGGEWLEDMPAIKLIYV